MPGIGRATEAGIGLARALINTSSLPLLLLDGELRIVSASRSFCAAFDVQPDQTDGRELGELGAGEWAIPELRALLESTLAGDLDAGPYETDLARADAETRRLIFNAQKVDYDTGTDVLMLVAISDVTDIRGADRRLVQLLFEKDDLLRERGVLLQEMQHRIANSLQIIASILMMKARSVSSEETREHLREAHDRVLSVAAVQQHLQTHLGDVEVGPYLTKLGESLGASMIRTSRALTLEVNADAALVSSHEAVSLGLIVTELVINALKHAFPDDADGRVVIGYAVDPAGWTLSVSDNGIGRPAASATTKVGLGTSVVEALARQLGARVAISDAGPGARIEIVHEGELRQSA